MLQITGSTTKSKANGVLPHVAMAPAKKARATLRRALKGGAILSIKEVEVTPAKAERMLEKANPSNRHTSRVTVDKYAEDMKSGRWVLTHQGIAIGPSGTILDGHHRLAAIVQSGVSIRTLLVTYASEEAYAQAIHAVDKGRGRTTGNVLELTGTVEPGRGVPVAAIIVALEDLRSNSPRTLSVDQTILLYLQHREAVDWAMATLPKSMFPSPLRAAFAYAYPTHKEAIMQFADMVVSGANLSAGSIALKFSRVRSTLCTTGGHSTRRRAMLITLRALLAHIRNEKMERLQESDEGRTYFEKRRKAMGMP